MDHHASLPSEMSHGQIRKEYRSMQIRSYPKKIPPALVAGRGELTPHCGPILGLRCRNLGDVPCFVFVDVRATKTSEDRLFKKKKPLFYFRQQIYGWCLDNLWRKKKTVWKDVGLSRVGWVCGEGDGGVINPLFLSPTRMHGGPPF